MLLAKITLFIYHISALFQFQPCMWFVDGDDDDDATVGYVVVMRGAQVPHLDFVDSGGCFGPEH